MKPDFQTTVMLKSIIVVLFSLIFVSCNEGIEEEDYHRNVDFYLDGVLYQSNIGQGTHYLNKQNGANIHSWEFHSNGAVALTVVAKDEDKQELQSLYEYPTVTATLLIEKDNNGVAVPFWYNSIAGRLTIDKFKKFTRDGSFDFIMVNEDLNDTLSITNGSYSLTNEDEPVIRE